MTSTPIPLSPMDHVFTGEGAYPIQLLLVFPGKIDVSRLKDAFTRALVNFSPLSSQLSEKDNRYTLTFQKDSFLFESEALSKAVDLDDPTKVPDLFLNVHSFPGEVLCKVKCWHAPEQSYLAVSISHCVADGYSFFYFLAAWSAAFHHSPIPEASHDRSVLIPAARSAKVTPESLWNSANLFWGEKRKTLEARDLEWEVFSYPRARLAELKAEARQTATQTLTDNDYLVGDLARRIGAEGDSLRAVGSVFDYRRIHPKLSKYYFGNAVRFCCFRLSGSELRASSLGMLATLNRQAVASMDVNAVESSLTALETFREQEGVEAFQQLTVADAEQGLLVTNLSRVPLDAIDFGTGKCVAVRSATPTPRTAIVLAAPEGLAVVYNYPVK